VAPVQRPTIRKERAATGRAEKCIMVLHPEKRLTTEAQRTQRLHREELIAAIYVQVVVTPKAF
jgi:hypothetical protein